CLVALCAAMVAARAPDSLARHLHRLSDRGYIPDKTRQPAVAERRFARDHCNVVTERAAKFRRQTGSVRCARALCCPPRWQLDAVDEVSLRRCDRLNDENHPARLDAKTV